MNKLLFLVFNINHSIHVERDIYIKREREMWTSRRERAFPMAKDMRGDSYLTKFPMVSPSLELEE